MLLHVNDSKGRASKDSISPTLESLKNLGHAGNIAIQYMGQSWEYIHTIYHTNPYTNPPSSPRFRHFLEANVQLQISTPMASQLRHSQSSESPDVFKFKWKNWLSFYQRQRTKKKNWKESCNSDFFFRIIPAAFFKKPWSCTKWFKQDVRRSIFTSL